MRRRTGEMDVFLHFCTAKVMIEMNLALRLGL